MTTSPIPSLTDSAAAEVARIMAGKGPGHKLRISVEGGGCSGYQYKYEMVTEEPEASDIVLEKDGAVVLIDDMSCEIMQGAEIDYVVRLGGRAFEIRNPNSSAECGCGNSFALPV